jgi:hypothetical protein
MGAFQEFCIAYNMPLPSQNRWLKTPIAAAIDCCNWLAFSPALVP